MYQGSLKLLILTALLLAVGCRQEPVDNRSVAPNSLHDVSALKLNFRFEADVPEPPATAAASADERNTAIQSDFDQNRAQETVEKMILSPDKKRYLVVYRKLEDKTSEYRLDMYAPDGKLLRKITPNGLAVHFTDTIVWSPASTSIAFVGVARSGPTGAVPETAPTPPDLETNVNTVSNSEANATANVDTNANTSTNTNANAASPVEPAKQVLTFQTEQIYICGSDGGDLKLLTQNDGLMFYYFVWSPDSSALAAMATTWQEWRFGGAQAEMHGELFVPKGRPRLVEITGRQRLLDDNPTPVQPVWSPDSSKIALAYDKDIRIYDAVGDTPTQASIPLRNPLLLSSKTFDEELKVKEQSNTNANAAANSAPSNQVANTGANTAANKDTSTLPDENTLVSFNPIVQLEWTEDRMLYLQTGYVRDMKDAADSVRSYLRWHRLMFSPQATKIS